MLLYELLTGSTPIEKVRLRRAAYGEVLRRIRDEEPPKPSTRLSESGDALPSIAAVRRTEPSKLTKLMRGEIDWIVMKSLEKDRKRRYETANAFTRDIGGTAVDFLQAAEVRAQAPRGARDGKRFRPGVDRGDFNQRRFGDSGVQGRTAIADRSRSRWRPRRRRRPTATAKPRRG